jgi:hypothetical protein
VTGFVLAGMLALGCVAPVLAGETVTEHDSYEKRSTKIETIPPAKTTERTVEETEQTGRVDRPREPVIEERKTVEPGPVVRERKTETRETTDGD